jgi:hypothetical protein
MDDSGTVSDTRGTKLHIAVGARTLFATSDGCRPDSGDVMTRDRLDLNFAHTRNEQRCQHRCEGPTRSSRKTHGCVEAAGYHTSAPEHRGILGDSLEADA